MKSIFQAYEIKILRKTERVTKKDKIKSDEIRHRVEIKNVLYNIKTQQLRWFEHQDGRDQIGKQNYKKKIAGEDRNTTGI